MMSRFFMAFFPRSRYLALQADSLPSEPPGKSLQGASVLISLLHLQCTEILEPKKIKSVTASTFSPSICQEVMELDAMNFLNVEF